MADMSTALDELDERIAAVVAGQSRDADPAHEDFYAWGWTLTELARQAEHVCRVLADQVEHYGDRRILRDDTGGDPAERLVISGDYLRTTARAFATAAEGAARYHSAVGHIAVEVDPSTDGAED